MATREEANECVRELEAAYSEPFDWASATDEDLLAGAKVGDRVRVETERGGTMSGFVDAEPVLHLNEGSGGPNLRSRDGRPQWRVVEILERAKPDHETLTPGQALDLALSGVAVTLGEGFRPRKYDPRIGFLTFGDGEWGGVGMALWSGPFVTSSTPWRRFVEPAAKPAPKTLTAAEAEAYLRECPWRRVMRLAEGDTLRWDGTHFVCPDGETFEHLAARYTIAPDEPPPWREVSAEDALRERRLHPDDEWEQKPPSYGWEGWGGYCAWMRCKYRHRPRRKGAT